MTPFEKWWKAGVIQIEARNESRTETLARAAWEAALHWQATQGGKSKAPRKVAAAKKNGKKGGRPKKAR